MNYNTTSDELVIDLSSLPSGLYLLRLEHLVNQNLFVQTIIKQ